MCGAVDERTDCLLPVESFGNVIAFKIVATREPQEPWVHGRKLFHDVDAVAVGPIVIGRREERYEIKPYRRRLRESELKVIVCGDRYLAGFQREGVLLPIGGHA